MAHLTARQAILDVLIRNESYGLAIRDDIVDRTKGALDLGPGTLYPALRAMERDGLVESRVGDPDESRGGRPRVWYKLTGEGRRVASEQREEFEGFFGFPAGVRHA